MSAQTRRRGGGIRGSWPQWSLGLFVVILVVTYALVFFTGDGKPTPKLGIDLQGGTRVTLVPQGQNPTPDQLEQARTILENRVNGMGVSNAQVITDGDTLVITVPGEDSQQARTLGQTSQLFFRPVLEAPSPDPGAMTDELRRVADEWVRVGLLTPEEANTSLKEFTDQFRSNIDQQKQAFEQQFPDQELPPQLDLEIPEAPSVAATPPPEPANSIEAAEQRTETRDVLLATRQSDDPTTQFATSALMRCEDPNRVDPLAGADDPRLPLLSCDPSSPGQVLPLGPAPLVVGDTDEENGNRLSGDDIDTNAPINGGFDQQSGHVQVSFKFKSGNADAGARTWTKLTTDMLNQRIAIVLDSQVISAPVIQEPTPVGEFTRITGDFTVEEAQTLANNLRYGALPLSFAGENGEPGGTTTTIPPTLGAASLQAGIIAGLVGVALIVLYAVAMYRGLGAISVVSLAAAGAMVYGVLVLLGRWIGYSLDLAGIAGIIISIGTTADSFIVFFERIKDEIRDGRTFRSSVPRAWRRARRTIWTGNFVSIIAAVVLYILAVGDVKGFAFTLGLSTTFDIITAFLVTAPLVVLASRKPAMAQPSMNGFGSVMELARDRRRAGRELPADSERRIAHQTAEEAK